MDLNVKLGNLNLNNPVTVASGTFGYAFEFEDLVDLKALGAIITKTITIEPRLGNPTPRLAETAAGMLNAIGLQNEGLRNFIQEKLPKLQKIGTKIIVSISGTKTEDFIYCAKKLEQAGVEAIELNLSCPNVKYKANSNKLKVKMFAQDEKVVYNLVHNVAGSINRKKMTLIAKLSPNVSDITVIAKAAETAGADAVSLVNTFIGMAIDIKIQKPKLANISGGLSGPAIKPIALKMVYDVACCVKIPVLGMGGIINEEDAIEFMLAGATAVSIGTANFINPQVSMEVIRGIKKYCQAKKIKSVREIIGKVKSKR